jgi:hypothetical protein
VDDVNEALISETEDEELAELERQRDALAAELGARLLPINARAQELFTAIPSDATPPKPQCLMRLRSNL